MSAAPAADLVASYVFEIVERAHELQELADHLSDLDFVAPEAPALIRTVSRIASEIRPAVLAQWQVFKRLKSDSERANSLGILRLMDQALRQIAGRLRLPASATSDRVPGVLSRLVAAKANELVKGAAVILRPQWNYNYRIRPRDVTDEYELLLSECLGDEKTKGVLAGLPKPLFIISFPAIERHSIHLHAVLGHELGHLISVDYRPPQDTDKAFLQKLYQTTGGKKEEDALASNARKSAIRELAADAASVFLFGTAAVLGAAHFAIASQLEAGPNSGGYPGWGRRLKAMLDLAKQEGWTNFSKIPDSAREVSKATKHVQARLRAIERWTDSTTELHDGEEAELAVMGHEAAMTLLPDIHAYLRKRYSNHFANPTHSFSCLPRLFNRLLLDLPPDTIGKDELRYAPPRLEDVFLASWWFRLSRVPVEFEQEDVDGVSRRKANNLRKLTLKAIENIDFYQRYADEIRRSEGKGHAIK